MTEADTTSRRESGHVTATTDAHAEAVEVREPPRAPGTPSRPAYPAAPGAPAAAGGEHGPLGAYEALARSPRLTDLVAIAQTVLGEAATNRRAPEGTTSRVTAAADDVKLAWAEAETPYGNTLQILGAGPVGEAERALACAIAAHAVAELQIDDEDKVAGDVLWLATQTAFDATSLLDRALGEEADDLWTAIAARVRRFDDGRGGAVGRGEALVGALALATSSSPAARKAAAELAGRTRDPMLARAFEDRGAQRLEEVRFEGELTAAPRGPVATTLLAVTGVLFVMHVGAAIARVALAYKQPAEVVLGASGVRVRAKTQMLGRTLREREHVIVPASLSRVVREVRYPRVAFYAGLLALALGSWVGVRALADGVRAASPSLLAVGLAIVAIGVALDFVLGSLLPGTRGRCRVSFVPREGRPVCVADVDASRADAAIVATLRRAAR